MEIKLLGVSKLCPSSFYGVYEIKEVGKWRPVDGGSAPGILSPESSVSSGYSVPGIFSGTIIFFLISPYLLTSCPQKGAPRPKSEKKNL